MVQVRQIKIGKHQTGIIGLDDALKEASEESQGFSDQKIGALMVEKLSKKTISPQPSLPFTNLPSSVNTKNSRKNRCRNLLWKTSK